MSPSADVSRHTELRAVMMLRVREIEGSAEVAVDDVGHSEEREFVGTGGGSGLWQGLKRKSRTVKEQRG